MKQLFTVLLPACILLWAENYAQAEDISDVNKAIESLTPDLVRRVVGEEKVEKYTLKPVKTEDPYANVPEYERPEGAESFYLYFNVVPKIADASLVNFTDCKVRLNMGVYPGAKWKITEGPECP